MKATVASFLLALLGVPALAAPTDANSKRGDIIADKYLLGSGYKRDLSSAKENKRGEDADEYDLRSAWSKRSEDADEYDLRSAWSKRSEDADEYDLRSAWSKRGEDADEYDLRSAWSKKE